MFWIFGVCFIPRFQTLQAQYRLFVAGQDKLAVNVLLSKLSGNNTI